MNRPEALAPAIPLAGTEATEPQLAPADTGTSRLLEKLRNGAEPDPLLVLGLTETLHRTDSPETAWSLLQCLEAAGADLEPAPAFHVLRRIAGARSVFVRFAAYERLARLHSRDMRFEMKAKLVLRDALAREQGAARDRLQGLLRRC